MNDKGSLNRAMAVIEKNGVQNGEGQGQSFHDMITELSKADKTVTDGRGDLFGTVQNLARFSSTLNRYDTKIVPVNPSGGLLARGHPIGATGCAQLVELTDQLRNRADRRQRVGAGTALALNAGGSLGLDEASAVVTILSAPEARA